MKKIFFSIAVIVTVAGIFFFLKKELNNFYNLLYINEYGPKHNSEREKHGYEVIPNDWYKKIEFDNESNRCFISWQMDLDSLINTNKPVFYSKSLTFFTDGLFNCSLSAETDVYINLYLEKLEYLKLINIYNYKEGNNIYMYDFELQNSNLLEGFEDLRELKKSTLRFHQGDNLVINRSVYDSILNSWQIHTPK